MQQERGVYFEEPGDMGGTDVVSLGCQGLADKGESLVEIFLPVAAHGRQVGYSVIIQAPFRSAMEIGDTVCQTYHLAWYGGICDTDEVIEHALFRQPLHHHGVFVEFSFSINNNFSSMLSSNLGHPFVGSVAQTLVQANLFLAKMAPQVECGKVEKT
jgi:hypothetical protein